MIQNRWRHPFLHNGRFANYPNENGEKTFWRAVRAFARLVFSSKPRINPDEMKEWVATYAKPQEFNDGQCRITWIGHATFLIEIGGKRILTDPIFSTLAYGLRFPRLTEPGISREGLPHIDAVLISHNHPDHMDASTLLFLKAHSNPTFIVPYGDRKWFERRGFEKVYECLWWEGIKVSPDVKCTFVPSVHWSQRGMFDRNKSLWGGWMIEQTTTMQGPIYFAGDTAYDSHFKAIAEAYSSIDVALMPIGPIEPRELMRCSHIGPEEAGQAFIDVGARSLIPMHWGAYYLGTEHPLEPIRRLNAWWHTNAPELEERSLASLKMGETMNLAPSAPFISSDISPLIVNK